MNKRPINFIGAGSSEPFLSDAAGSRRYFPIGEKADYVRGAPATAGHFCHWPGCGKEVPPARWGCAAHWYLLPLSLRTRIWNAYRPGQELAKDPSREYVEAATAVRHWIENYLREKQATDAKRAAATPSLFGDQQ